jgi:hypothetical protein
MHIPLLCNGGNVVLVFDSSVVVVFGTVPGTVDNVVVEVVSTVDILHGEIGLYSESLHWTVKLLPISDIDILTKTFINEL